MAPTTDRVPSIEIPPSTPCQKVAAEIKKYSGWDHQVMQAIAQAENRSCDPTRHNLTMSEDHKVCIGSYGVLQVGCLHYKASEDRNNLVINVKVAHRVWQQQGYQAWTMYNNGGYKKFL